ncbi:MAG: S1 RNA-binding domain-containing protein [Caldisericaceae bacterium]
MGDKELIGRVIKVMPYGAFVKINDGKTGLIHVSQFVENAVDEPLKEGDLVEVKTNGKDKSGKLNLIFLKKVSDKVKSNNQNKDNFEDLLKKFLKESQESMSLAKRRIKRHRREAA